jgi:type I site-specific restriction-modification system R (restriction) subunit
MGFFKSLPSVQSKYKTQFYDQLQQMNEVFALQRLYESRNEWDKAMTVATDNKNLLMWRKSYNRVNRKIQQINRQIRLIEADKRLSNAEIIDKVRQLNVLKNDMIRALIEQVLEYEKKTGERVKRERWFTL